jgi:hypothetical protein
METKNLQTLLSRVFYSGKPKKDEKRYVDYKLEFKCVFKSPIDKVIEERYVNNEEKTQTRILSYFYFNDKEYDRLVQSINKFNMSNHKDFFAINAIQ